MGVRKNKRRPASGRRGGLRAQPGVRNAKIHILRNFMFLEIFRKNKFSWFCQLSKTWKIMKHFEHFWLVFGAFYCRTYEKIGDFSIFSQLWEARSSRSLDRFFFGWFFLISTLRDLLIALCFASQLWGHGGDLSRWISEKSIFWLSHPYTWR